MLIEQSQMRSISRNEYNKAYYERNKEKIAQKKKQRGKSKVIQLFAKTDVDFDAMQALCTIGRWLEILALTLLVVVMTSFLVREAAGFYLEACESPLCAYVKAGMVEGIAILFSLSRGRSLFLRRSQQALVVLLCGLTLWTMSGKLIRTASSDTVRVQTLTRTVTDLEGEIAQKQTLRQELLARGWLGAARRYEKGLDQIRQKLKEARATVEMTQAPQVVINSLGVLIAFRCLLVAANLICLHRLFEHFTDSAVRRRAVPG